MTATPAPTASTHPGPVGWGRCGGRHARGWLSFVIAVAAIPACTNEQVTPTGADRASAVARIGAPTLRFDASGDVVVQGRSGSSVVLAWGESPRVPACAGQLSSCWDVVGHRRYIGPFTLQSNSSRLALPEWIRGAGGWLQAQLVGQHRGRSLAVPVPTAAFAPPNVLVVVLDDWGIDVWSPSGTPTPLSAPMLEELARRSVRVPGFYTHPSCSPTRAAALTGVDPSRYLLGEAIGVVKESFQVPTEAVTMAEYLGLRGYTSGALGKWHLSSVDLASGAGMDNAREQGFERHRGSLGNLMDDASTDGQPMGYSDWEKFTDGVPARTTTYATTDTVDEAISFVTEAQAPWFAWVALNAPHQPWHQPPAALLSDTSVVATAGDRYRLMIEAADNELSRLLDAAAESGPTYIVVFGDNGTPDDVQPAGSWFDTVGSKGTVTEGGVRTPFMISGPGLPEDVDSIGLMQDIDLVPTILGLTGAPLPPWEARTLDGVDQSAWLLGDAPTSARAIVHVDRFKPNGEGPYVERWRMVTDGRYKWTVNINGDQALYDLASEWPDVTDVLLDGVSADEASAIALFEDWIAQKTPPRGAPEAGALLPW